jgi:hypothetical protein
LCHGFFCSDVERLLRCFWVFGEFLDKIGLTGFPCLREAKSYRSGLAGLGCQQPCRVCFRYVCAVVVGWVLFLGAVALQWLRELGKRSLRRCTSEIGLIGQILE